MEPSAGALEKLEDMMNSKRTVSRAVTLAVCLLLTVICLQANANRLGATGNAHSVAVPKPTPPATSEEAKTQVDDTFVLTETIQKEKKETPASGPPAKRDKMAEAEQIRAMFIKNQLEQEKKSADRAKNAKNSAEAEVYAKDARLKSEAAQAAAQNLAVAAPPQPASSQTGN